MYGYLVVTDKYIQVVNMVRVKEISCVPYSVGFTSRSTHRVDFKSRSTHRVDFRSQSSPELDFDRHSSCAPEVERQIGERERRRDSTRRDLEHGSVVECDAGVSVAERAVRVRSSRVHRDAVAKPAAGARQAVLSRVERTA